MSTDVVIHAEGLGKKYMIGHQSNERYTALRDVIARSAKGMARTAGDMLRGRPIYSGDELEEFWALKDVSFEIQRGDVVGIIGSNGAGKSTLLKVLSRITEPSEGRVAIKGRVASLLEVGTGFHPELTGRENIYLNGAILGMTRAEIHRKFDEIVDFAETEKFLDTPVKRYSSGMYVRLAFAVAAHLEPEILIIDEVLAVGDATFQKKCLGKIQNVAGLGRTVLFVSHNIGLITEICRTAILLNAGRVASISSANEGVDKYLALLRSRNSEYSIALNDQCNIWVRYEKEAETGALKIQCRIKFSHETVLESFAFILCDRTRHRIALIPIADLVELPAVASDHFEIDLSISLRALVPGDYFIDMNLRSTTFTGNITVDHIVEVPISMKRCALPTRNLYIADL